MKNIVVTGATSMIGSAVIRSCLHSSVETVYAVVRPNSLKLDHLPDDPRIQIIECGVEDLLSLPEKISGPVDTFYHIAWGLTGEQRNKGISDQASNVRYTVDAVISSHKIGCTKFIGAGSQAEYGYTKDPLMSPDTAVNPVQPYGIAKYAAGRLAKAQAEALGVDFIWVRIFSIYGPYDKPTTMISSTIRKMLSKEHTSFTEGTQIWDYLYVEDAGDAFYRIGEMVTGSHIYCLGSGEGKPLKEYISELRDAVDPTLSVGFGEVPYRDKRPLSICADISSLTRDTNWKPATSFSDGIRITIDAARRENQ